MEVKIEEIEKGFMYKYPNGVNDVAVIYEEKGRRYFFKQCFNNFNLKSGDGGERQKDLIDLDKGYVKNPKDTSLRFLQDVLISEVLPKYESLDFKVIRN